MFHRNKRILWLLNHKTLMPYEAQLLLNLGFEVFVPKVIPKAVSFRSGAVDFAYDGSLTIPQRAEALERVQFSRRNLAARHCGNRKPILWDSFHHPV